ncbi:MAG: DUF2294 domain-containing protein [Thermoleophilaceae bacterium]|jgi:uncharacterized protein YbcI
MNLQDRHTQGEIGAAISTAVVHLLAQRTGKGPTRAKTTLGENGVFVVLEDNLTRGERNLAAAGGGATVLAMRRNWQRVMQDEMSATVEELTGRKVTGFMSDNHLDPDLAVEVFVFERLAERAS